MLSKFGKLARDHRDQLGLSVGEFAKLVRLSTERIEACENQRLLCNEELVALYQHVLGIADGSLPHQELTDAAEDSNRRYTYHRKFLGDDRLMALLARYSDVLSDEVKSEVHRIVSREIARLSSAPKYHPNDRAVKEEHHTDKDVPQPCQRRANLPSLGPARFAKLLLLSEKTRQRYVDSDEPLSAVAFLKAEAEVHPDLSFEVCSNMPLFAPDSDVVIAGGSSGYTIYAHDGFVEGCAKDPKSIGNHLLLHEYAHYCLHADEIRNSKRGFMPPHRLAQFGSATLQDNDLDSVFELTSLIELEADFFATLLTIPWIKLAEAAMEDYKLQFMTSKLVREYGAPKQVTERVIRYLRIDVARDRIREQLYRQNRIDHPFLLLL